MEHHSIMQDSFNAYASPMSSRLETLLSDFWKHDGEYSRHNVFCAKMVSIHAALFADPVQLSQCEQMTFSHIEASEIYHWEMKDYTYQW